MAKLQRIEIISLAKFLGIMFGIIGLVFGVVYAIAGVVAGVLFGSEIWIALLALIVIPLLFAFSGFVQGMIIAILYNATARLTGGVELNFRQ